MFCPAVDGSPSRIRLDGDCRTQGVREKITPLSRSEIGTDMDARPLHDVVWDIVSKNAPNETAVFDELYRDSLSDPQRAAAHAAPGANAMGVEIATFLTPVLIAVLSDVTKDLLGTGLRALVRRVWHRLTGDRSVAENTTVRALSAAELLSVSADLARRLRQRGYAQAEIDQICRDLSTAAAVA